MYSFSIDTNAVNICLLGNGAWVWFFSDDDIVYKSQEKPPRSYGFCDVEEYVQHLYVAKENFYTHGVGLDCTDKNKKKSSSKVLRG